MLAKDVRFAHEEVVADVEAGHGRDVGADDARGHVLAEFRGRALVLFDRVQGLGLKGFPFLDLAVPFKHARVEVPAVVIET